MHRDKCIDYSTVKNVMKFKFLTLMLPIVFIRHHVDNVQKHLNFSLLMRHPNFMMIQHPTTSLGW